MNAFEGCNFSGSSWCSPFGVPASVCPCVVQVDFHSCIIAQWLAAPGTKNWRDGSFEKTEFNRTSECPIEIQRIMGYVQSVSTCARVCNEEEIFMNGWFLVFSWQFNARSHSQAQAGSLFQPSSFPSCCEVAIALRVVQWPAKGSQNILSTRVHGISMLCFLRLVVNLITLCNGTSMTWWSACITHLTYIYIYVCVLFVYIYICMARHTHKTRITTIYYLIKATPFFTGPGSQPFQSEMLKHLLSIAPFFRIGTSWPGWSFKTHKNMWDRTTCQVPCRTHAAEAENDHWTKELTPRNVGKKILKGIQTPTHDHPEPEPTHESTKTHKEGGSTTVSWTKPQNISIQVAWRVKRSSAVGPHPAAWVSLGIVSRLFTSARGISILSPLSASFLSMANRFWASKSSQTRRSSLWHIHLERGPKPHPW